MKAYCQISEIFYYEGDPMDPGGNMMLKCNFPGMLKLSIVWQKNVHIKIAKSSYKAAFIYVTKNLPPKTVCLMWKYFPKIQQSQNT